MGSECDRRPTTVEPELPSVKRTVDDRRNRLALSPVTRGWRNDPEQKVPLMPLGKWSELQTLLQHIRAQTWAS